MPRSHRDCISGSAVFALASTGSRRSLPGCGLLVPNSQAEPYLNLTCLVATGTYHAYQTHEQTRLSQPSLGCKSLQIALLRECSAARSRGRGLLMQENVASPRRLEAELLGHGDLGPKPPNQNCKYMFNELHMHNTHI